MPKVTDVRGKPGDFVIPRGGQPISIWRTTDEANNDRAGVVMPGAFGIIVATYRNRWTYVLWSVPIVMGWVDDGYLRPLKVKDT